MSSDYKKVSATNRYTDNSSRLLIAEWIHAPGYVATDSLTSQIGKNTSMEDPADDEPDTDIVIDNDNEEEREDESWAQHPTLQSRSPR